MKVEYIVQRESFWWNVGTKPGAVVLGPIDIGLQAHQEALLVKAVFDAEGIDSLRKWLWSHVPQVHIVANGQLTMASFILMHGAERLLNVGVQRPLI